MKKVTIAKKTSQKKFAWRKNPKVWTDTLFDKKQLSNPALMTNIELATALEEHQMWRTSQGKYDWKEDPIKEGKENDPPFSPKVLSNLIWETIARLKISGELASTLASTLGMFKR